MDKLTFFVVLLSELFLPYLLGSAVLFYFFRVSKKQTYLWIGLLLLMVQSGFIYSWNQIAYCLHQTLILMPIIGGSFLFMLTYYGISKFRSSWRENKKMRVYFGIGFFITYVLYIGVAYFFHMMSVDCGI